MMKPDKYLDRLEAIAEMQALHTQLDRLIGAVDDSPERRYAILCLQDIGYTSHWLRTTLAPFPVLGFNQRADVAALASKAKRLLEQLGNA